MDTPLFRSRSPAGSAAASPAPACGGTCSRGRLVLSAAITVLAWVAAYVLADVRGWRRWPATITIAGENALVVYLLAPFLVSVFALLGVVLGTNPYYALGGSLGLGVVRAVVFAWLVIRLAGWMNARGVRLQL